MNYEQTTIFWGVCILLVELLWHIAVGRELHCGLPIGMIISGIALMLLKR